MRIEGDIVMRYCSECGSKVLDDAKFCENCGKPLQYTEKERTSQREQEYEGKIYKCPNCGEILPSFSSNCPSCGYEIRGNRASDSIRELASCLDKARTNGEKASVIQNFPIPNSKEDILEFLILASSNLEFEEKLEIASAWQSKLEQVMQKARLLIKDEVELAEIENQYRRILKLATKKKNIRNVKNVGNALAELVPILPQFIVVFGWITSFFVLLPLCRVNLDNVGVNGFQLLLMLDFIAGAVFVPVTMRTSSPLPKAIVTSGIFLSLVFLIPLCGENLDNAGANAFQLILIVEAICCVIIFVRTVRYSKKKNESKDSINKVTLFIVIICLAMWGTIYLVGNISAKRNAELPSITSPSISGEERTNDSDGIYTYEIRNYVGKNVGSFNDTVADQLVDNYGSGYVRLVFITEDGMLLTAGNEEERKGYTVTGQNVAAGSSITVVHLRDSKGEPYSNFVDYQSIEEILLYVAPIGVDEFLPEYTTISPTLDRHSFHIRDYVGRNAASFGRTYGDTRVDCYGSAKLELSFATKDGAFFDSSDLNVLKKYIIVEQDIAPDSELKVEYETDSKGQEYDGLIRSQNYQIITLWVETIDESVVDKLPEIEQESRENSSEEEYTELTLEYQVIRGNKAEIIGYSGEGNRVTIDRKIDGHEVVSIGDNAFKDCDTLESVLFWADIESIGEYAFAGCTALTDISVPNSTKSIGAHAFEGCTNLVNPILWGDPEIGEYAFAGCESIVDISIGYETPSIGVHAFDGCKNLETVTIWNDDTIIEKDAFANCPKLTDRPIQK